MVNTLNTYCFPISCMCMDLITIDLKNLAINPSQNWIFNPDMRTYNDVI